MGESLTVNNTISLILVAISLLALGGCVYKFYNVNCDPQAIDKFNEFIDLFEKCGVNNQCSEFVINNIPYGHEILIESKGSSTNVNLMCNERKGMFKEFDKGFCRVSSTSQIIQNEGTFEISRDEDEKFNFVKVENKVCFSKIDESYLLTDPAKGYIDPTRGY
jgi:hypothetical protein